MTRTRCAAWVGRLAAVAAAVVCAGCESGGDGGGDGQGGAETARSLAPAASGEIRGTVNARQWAMIPAGTVVTVRLVDVRRADAPPVVLAEEVMAQPRSVPVAFVLRFDPARIVASGRYQVSARVEVNGRLRWISNSTATTRGAAPGANGAPVDVWVEPLGGR